MEWRIIRLMNNYPRLKISLAIVLCLIGAIAGVTLVLLNQANQSESSSSLIMKTKGLIKLESNETYFEYWAFIPTVQIQLRVKGYSDSTIIYILIRNVNFRHIQITGFKEKVEITPLSNTSILLCHTITKTIEEDIEIGLNPLSLDNLTFAAIGDTHGYNNYFLTAMREAANKNVLFALHCGDMTSFGTKTQFQNLINIFDQSPIPIYTTPGNHDIKTGLEIYSSFLGNSTYYFDVSRVRFVSVDSSGGTIDQTQQNYLRNILSEVPNLYKIVWTHIPPFDNLTSTSHDFINDTDAKSFLSLLSSFEVDLLITGHLHLFNYSTMDGIKILITGGGGAPLYTSSTQGGFHHFSIIKKNTTGLYVDPIPLNIEINFPQFELISSNVSYFFSLDDLKLSIDTNGYSSFQNYFGNWQGYGFYEGVSLRSFIEYIGGISPNDIVNVHAKDGYEYNVTYWNIYPNETWRERQGELILAISFNHSLIPDWSEGPRMVFLAPDKAFSNEDYRLTSYPGLGYYRYPSAGSSWVTNVDKITIIANGLENF